MIQEERKMTLKDNNSLGSVQNLILENNSTIQRDLKAYVSEATINGTIQKDVYITANKISIPEDIQNVIDEIIDRYGVMPKELENLIEVARIKELCRTAGIIKVSEKKNMFTEMQNIVFYFDKNKYNPDIVDKLVKKYGYDIKFSAGIEPYVTLRVNTIKDEELIGKIKDFLKECIM